MGQCLTQILVCILVGRKQMCRLCCHLNMWLQMLGILMKLVKKIWTQAGLSCIVEHPVKYMA